MANDMTARKIVELLRIRHSPPEWATFAELMGGTGYSDSRRLDFFALNCYPSKKHVAIAYEVKVTRADFAREFKDPKKRGLAESVANECYFVVPAGLVKPDEVPEGWGLLECNAGGLRQVKMATQRTIEPWPLSFMAAIARRSADPESRLPVAVWKVLDKELGEKELLAIAYETAKEKLQKERAAIEDAVRRDIYDSLEYKALKQTDQSVGRVFGWHNSWCGWTVEELRRAAGGGSLTENDVNDLKYARDVLNRVLGKKKTEQVAGAEEALTNG